MRNILLESYEMMEKKLLADIKKKKDIVFGRFLSKIAEGDFAVIEECKKLDSNLALKKLSDWEVQRKSLLAKAKLQSKKSVEYIEEIVEMENAVSNLRSKIYYERERNKGV